VIRKLFSSDAISKDLGLLIVRLGVGLSMAVFHGYGKMSAGPEGWDSLGGAMERFGIGFLPVFWGFMAAFAEFACSGLLILGFLFRPAAFLLAVNMLVAVVHHLTLPPDSPSHGWAGASHAAELLAVYLGLLFTGPGKFALAPRRKG
jgi:putative oxidoreductase